MVSVNNIIIINKYSIQAICLYHAFCKNVLIFLNMFLTPHQSDNVQN